MRVAPWGYCNGIPGSPGYECHPWEVSIALFDHVNITGTNYFFTTVPEPPTLALFAFGALALAGMRRPLRDRLAG